MHFGSPTAASPNSNSILAQPPLQEENLGLDAMGGDASFEGDSRKIDGSSAPVGASDNPLDAPDAPRTANDGENSKEDAEMADAQDEVKPIHGEEKEGEEAGGENGAANGQTEQTKASIEASARSHLMKQTHSIILPSYSTWFDMRAINEIERKSLPEFFNNRNRSKTPAVYKDYRDFMINTYRLNPVEYLTVTACRRNLAGDVCAIMRVHACLEQWGLINYQVDADCRPSNVGPPFTGHFRVIADTPRGLQHFQPAPDSKVTAGKPFLTTDRKLSTTPQTDLNLELGRNIYESNGKDVGGSKNQVNGDLATNGTSDSENKSIEDLVKDREPVKRVNCFTCGVDCTRVYYHNDKAADATVTAAGSAAVIKQKFNICPNCFLEARIPSSNESKDFIKRENLHYTTIPDRDAPWTDSEMLLLLEGLEQFDDDWTEISEHVGTRTREECILKFLSLEIEDKYLETEPNLSGSNGLGILGTQGGYLPFHRAENPVMSVVAFLASLSDPNVVAAAAGKSVETMKQNLRQQAEKSVNGDSKGKGKEIEGADNNDSMDIDILQKTTTTTTTTTRTSIQTLASIPLAAAAARSQAITSHEEREMSRILSASVNATLNKWELKLAQFGEMESMLQAERRELERSRQQLFLDRAAFKRHVRSVQEGLRNISQNGNSGEQQGFFRAAGSGLDRMAFEGGKMPSTGLSSMGLGNGEGIKSYDS